MQHEPDILCVEGGPCSFASILFGMRCHHYRRALFPSIVHHLESSPLLLKRNILSFVLPRQWVTSQAAFNYQACCSPLGAGDMYVEDFLLVSQSQAMPTNALCLELHAIDAVLRPLTPQDPPSGKNARRSKCSCTVMWPGPRRKPSWAGTSTPWPTHYPCLLDRLHELL